MSLGKEYIKKSTIIFYLLQPDVVLTIRKIRKYVGPQTNSATSRQQDDWSANARLIRLKADGT